MRGQHCSLTQDWTSIVYMVLENGQRWCFAGGMLFNFLAITYGNREIHHYPVRLSFLAHKIPTCLCIVSCPALLDNSDNRGCRCYRGKLCVQGWRVMFFVVACFAAVAAVAVFLGGIEPRTFQKDRGDQAGNDIDSGRTSFGQAVWQGLRLIFTSTRTVFRIRCEFQPFHHLHESV